MINSIKILQPLLLLLVLHSIGSLAFLGSPSMNKSPWSLGGTDDHGTRTAIFAGCDEGNFPEPRVLRDFEELMNGRFAEDFGISRTAENLGASIESNGFTDLQIDETVESANLEPDNDVKQPLLVNIPKNNDALHVTQNFDHSLLDPINCTPETFVKELETYTLSHKAVENRFLQNIASATFGREETAKLLLQFFTAYSRFNQEFVGNVAKLRDLVTNENHKAILSANLKEENGIYDEDTLIELEELGICRESVQNVPHPELYQDMVSNLGKLVGSTYNYNPDSIIPEKIVEIKKVAIAELIADGKSGLLSAIYFGSELIVPALYTKLLQGLRQSCDISNTDARFLILHIDVDHSHAILLREIVVENCATKEERVKILKNTEKILKARVDFYDALGTQIA